MPPCPFIEILKNWAPALLLGPARSLGRWEYTQFDAKLLQVARDQPEEVSADPPADVDPILNIDVVEQEYFEGDIVNITKVDISESLMQTHNGRNAIRNRHQLWPNGKVVFCEYYIYLNRCVESFRN